jgi:hypothetical protein
MSRLRPSSDLREAFLATTLASMNHATRIILPSVLAALLFGIVSGSTAQGSDATVRSYQGSSIYQWDGRYLAKYQGRRLYEWDGRYLSRYQGKRLYEWDGRYLSQYQGKRIYEVDERGVAAYQGRRLFTWDGEHISRYQGSRFLTVKGVVPLPVLALLASGML